MNGSFGATTNTHTKLKFETKASQIGKGECRLKEGKKSLDERDWQKKDKKWACEFEFRFLKAYKNNEKLKVNAGRIRDGCFMEELTVNTHGERRQRTLEEKGDGEHRAWLKTRVEKTSEPIRRRKDLTHTDGAWEAGQRWRRKMKAFQTLTTKQKPQWELTRKWL